MHLGFNCLRPSKSIRGYRADRRDIPDLHCCHCLWARRWPWHGPHCLERFHSHSGFGHWFWEKQNVQQMSMLWPRVICSFDLHNKIQDAHCQGNIHCKESECQECIHKEIQAAVSFEGLLQCEIWCKNIRGNFLLIKRGIFKQSKQQLSSVFNCL